MVPEKKRASAWAWRWVIAAVIGIAAGRFIYFVIEQYSMTRAYALMHLATFAFMMVSYGVMFFLREVDHPQRNRALPYRKAWGKYRQVWTENAKFRRYLWVKISGLGLFFMAPYLTITALEEKGRAESSMGSLVMAQMAGGIAGNLLAAQLGDRWGGRSISVAARVLCMLLCLFLLINSSYIGYLLALFFFGVVYYLFAVGELTLGVELLPREGRPYFMALQNLSMVPGILAINAMTYFLWRCSESFSVLVLATLLLSLLSLFLLRSLPEPRQKA